MQLAVNAITALLEQLFFSCCNVLCIVLKTGGKFVSSVVSNVIAVIHYSSLSSVSTRLCVDEHFRVILVLMLIHVTVPFNQ